MGVAGQRRGAGRSKLLRGAAALLLALTGVAGVGLAGDAAADEPVGEPGAAGEPAAAGEPGATPTAPPPTAADVQEMVTDYIAAALRAAVVDVDGHPASCVCAVAVSVGLDGPANAVAAAGRPAGSAPGGDGPAGDASTGAGRTEATAASGRSGDATALSVTGSGGASSSATSGSTGAVRLLTTAGAGSAPEPSGVTDATVAQPEQRSTTVRVGQLTTALRQLVHELGDTMAAAAGADAGPQVHDLLAGLPGRDGFLPAGSATAEVAAWDGTGDVGTTLSCPSPGDAGRRPGCALAIAVSATSGAQAIASPPSRASAASSTPADGAVPGLPGMASAVSVALSGSAVSSARTGDAGARPPHAALEEVDPAAGTAPGTAAARSGRSGGAVAVALTVRGGAATSAVTGDTGSATGLVAGGAPPSGTGSALAQPGDGGSADAQAASGDSGDALTLASGAEGAGSASTSGTTGDATAVAAPGAAGTDWSEPDGTASGGSGGSTPLAVGGAGGSAAATSRTGGTGASVALVISGGAAAATAATGDTGDSSATAAGGTGGDTQVAGGGVGTSRSGDGGAAQVDGASGATGGSVAVLVTPYDGTGASRSGRSGNVSSDARGGDAGCASSGVAPEKACTSPAPEPSPEQAAQQQSGAAPDSGTSPEGQQPAGWLPTGGQRLSGSGSARDGAVARVHARSADSSSVRCRSTPHRARCRGADTEQVRASATASGGGATSAASTSASSTSAASTSAVLAGAVRSPSTAMLTIAPGRLPPPDRPAAAVRATSPLVVVPAVQHDGDVPSTPEPRAAGSPSTVALLVNAAVPVLALLSLVAMGAAAHRKRHPRQPAYVPRHRRRPDLPKHPAARPR